MAGKSVIHRESWYKEALERDILGLVRLFQDQPSWETFQSLLRASERTGQDIPYGVFRMKAPWHSIITSMRDWMKANESIVTSDILGVYWLMTDSGGDTGWPMNIPAWFITRARKEDVPPVNVTSLYAFTDGNHVDDLDYYNLDGDVLEVGWYRPEDGGHEPILTHHLTMVDELNEEEGGMWGPNLQHFTPEEYPVRAMSLKTLLEALRGYEEGGGIWESERDTPEDVASRYPSVDGGEILYIVLSNDENNWQIRDAEIQAWLRELR